MYMLAFGFFALDFEDARHLAERRGPAPAFWTRRRKKTITTGAQK
jgi:hypothetical protein